MQDEEIYCLLQHRNSKASRRRSREFAVIKVIDDGTKKVIVGGIKEIEEIIVEILPYLGSDHSELMPIAVEVWDEREPRFSEAFRQRRRKEQNSSGNYFA